MAYDDWKRRGRYPWVPWTLAGVLVGLLTWWLVSH
jgi:hypothetical protein